MIGMDRIGRALGGVVVAGGTARAALALALALGGCSGARSSASTLSNHDGGHVVALAWQAVDAPDEHVAVSVDVDGKPVALGSLEGATDGGPGGASSCEIRPGATATKVDFECGGTPAYNYYEAELKGGELVVTLVTGVEAEDAAPEQRTEVKRVPVTGSTLEVAKFVAPAAAAPPP